MSLFPQRVGRIALSWLILGWALPCFAEESTIRFEPLVRQLLEKRCWSCHGTEKQKGGLRLDQREAAITGGGTGPAVVPGQSGKSLLIDAIRGVNDALKMPPNGPSLTPQEIDLLRRWIDSGADWPATETPKDPEWWAFQPIQNPPEPKLPKGEILRNPIDAFVRARLPKGVLPNPPADRVTLIRRVYYDLIGLPPTPEQVRQFVEDTTPEAYERVIDQLLASPRYGERWARHWLDVVHFAETHGHDQDRPRENAWPYRDYVIQSLNADKPYVQFVVEQVAADVVAPNHPAVIPALGMLAAGPWDESTLRDIREDTLDRQIGRYLDRDDIITNVMSTFTSTTVHCARCHDHKFDPISQADYYALQAVFAGTDKANHLYDPDPAISQQRTRWQDLKQVAEKRDGTRIEQEIQQFPLEQRRAWEQVLTQTAVSWENFPAESATTLNKTELRPLEDGSYLAQGPSPEKETYTFIYQIARTSVTGIQLEVLPDDSLAHRGPGRQDNGNLHLSEVQVKVATAAKPSEFQPVKIVKSVADFDQTGWGAAQAIDGNPQTAWGIYPEVGKAHSIVFELAQPVGSAEGVLLQVVLEQLHGGRHTIGRPRLRFTTHPAPSRSQPLSETLVKILNKPRENRTSDEQRELDRVFLEDTASRNLAALPPQQAVYCGTSQFPPDGSHRPSPTPRVIHRLRRGEITKPEEVALPGTLSCVTALPARFNPAEMTTEGARRAALAQWLTARENPLVWRSIVNRIWHYHFGKGVVDTPNDFGKQGSLPSHPELLDWLAYRFREGGGSWKALHRLILTSDTYQQSTQTQTQAATVDSDNRLLWRMNRERLDAEAVRDSLLQFSGKIDLTMGGPSVKQFVMSPGVHVTPKVDYLSYDLDGPGNSRRAIYRFLFRTLPDPMMEALDCPAGDQLAPTRSESVTALQALTMMNNPFVVRQCEHIAQRLERQTPQTTQRVQLAFELILLRGPTPEELKAFEAYATKHGLANACRLLINSNEFLFVN